MLLIYGKHGLIKMSVDVSDLKRGDIVVFRCGGKATFKSMKPVGTKFNILFEGSVIESAYSLTGFLYHGSINFDIIEIIKNDPSC